VTRSDPCVLGRNELFQGLDEQGLEHVAALMRPRRFEPGEAVCRAGDEGESLFVIVEGLAQVVLPDPDSGGTRVVAKLRRGDVVGEMSLLSGEPRSATVVASIRTVALELGRAAFAEVLTRHPAVLANLTRILTRRLAETTARVAARGQRGEAVALVVGRSAENLVPEIVAATAAASPRAVAALDAQDSVEDALAALDDALAAHGTVLVVVGAVHELLPLVLEHVDRVVVLVETREAAAVARLGQRADIVLIGPAGAGADALRVLSRDEDGTVPRRDVEWLGRHLSRTKVGLALGAGGAKGYAHIGVFEVLEQAGYTVDVVTGSSIGAVVGAWHALGRDAGELETTMRGAFTPEVVEEMFTLSSMAGRPTGLETLARVFRDTTEDRSIEELPLPFVAMTADLNERRPVPLTEGPIWQALLAATALAPVYPPYERDGQRLVDGLALVPVPTGAAFDAGADIVVSVNLISRDTLSAWPGEPEPTPTPPARGSRMLDTLLEVMDLAQLDSSVRHAELADVAITPRFGPSTWRDFHLGDHFLEAGRKAAAEELPRLQALARPQLTSLPT